MPKLHYTEKLTPNLSIGVQVGKGVTGVGYLNKELDERTNHGAGVWTARIKFPSQNPKFHTTKIKYDPYSSFNKQEAIKIAYEILSGYADRVGRGLSVHELNYIHKRVWDYLDDADKWAQENDALVAGDLEPIHLIHGGRTYWSAARYEQAEGFWRNYLTDFVKSLPVPKGMAASTLDTLDYRDLDELDTWLLQVNPILTIETRLKIITELRHFFHWAYFKRLVTTVPSIRRPHRGGVRGARERMRKEITPELYREIIDYTREKYLDTEQSEYRRDYSYLFHLYILIMSNCGIRTPTSGLEHTMVRWEHVNLGEDGSAPALTRESEKGHTYDAIFMPSAVRYLTELRNFYETRGIKCDKGYMFRHPHYQYYSMKNPDERKRGEVKIAKGDHIVNFKTQWNNMCKKLGIHEFGTKDNPVPQSERISPSSMRAWFITQRLYSDKNVKIELLARVTGTSISQIEARYLRLDM
ncbi:MAG: hypothetical protein CBD16_02400, partial [Betaproteobacteria bacterium TMED156]